MEVFASKETILREKLEKHVNGPEFDITTYISLYALDVICGKNNVSHLKGVQHELRHINMKLMCGHQSALRRLGICGVKVVKVACFLSKMQGITGSKGKVSFINNFGAAWSQVSTFIN